MKDRFVQLSLTVLFICALFARTSAAYEESGVSAIQSLGKTDSVNVKQMLLSQIQKAKEKMQAGNIVSSDAYDSKTDKETIEGSKETISAGITDDLFMKVFILIDAALGAFLFIVWRRRKLNINKAEKTHLKQNILKLRQEKVGRISDSRLDTYRKQIKIDPVLSAEADNQYLIKHAKKLSVSVGELQLAARIKSYQREVA